MTRKIDQYRSEFKDFVSEIPILLDQLQSELSEGTPGLNLKSFELETLDKAENFYGKFLDGKIKSTVTDNSIHRAMVALLGETLIHHAGGKWTLCEKIKHPLFGAFFIHGFKNDLDGTGYCPQTVRDWFRKERKPGKFKDTINFCLNMQEMMDDIMKDF